MGEVRQAIGLGALTDLAARLANRSNPNEHQEHLTQAGPPGGAL
jgi:hypothetical protein